MWFSQITSSTLDLILFSDRPVELLREMSKDYPRRFMEYRKYFIFTRPHYSNDTVPGYSTISSKKMTLLTPIIPGRLSDFHKTELAKLLIDKIIRDQKIEHYHLWYSDTQAYPYTKHLTSSITICDGFCAHPFSLFDGIE